MTLRRFALPSASRSARPPAEERLDYWRRVLADLQPLDLPADFSRPPVFSRRGASRSLEIAGAAAERLAALAAGSGGGLAETLLAGVAALLHRITGSAGIAIGVPSEGGGEPVVLRLQVDGGRGFAELAAQAARVAGEAFAHAGESLEGLAAEFDGGRDPSRHPLFQVGFRLGRPERPGEARLDLEFHFAEALAARVESAAPWSTPPTSSRPRRPAGCWPGSPRCSPPARRIRPGRSPACR